MKDSAFIYLHIPKNGGTTINSILDRMFPANEVFTIETPDSKTLTTNDFINLPEAKRHRIRLLKGHMSFGLHEFMKPPVRYITFLRKPVDRIISYYYYVLSRPGHHVRDLIEKNKWSLHDFVLNITQGDVHNAQVRMISGINDTGDTMLGKAMENIENYFDMVGLLEEFDDSLILMKHILQIKTPYYMVMKKGAKKPSSGNIEKETIDLIRERNRADQQLYEEVRKQFDLKLNSVPDMAAERFKLRAVNKIYSIYKSNNFSRLLKNWHLYPSKNPLR